MNRAPVTRFIVLVNVGIHIFRLFYLQLDPYSWDTIISRFGIVPVDFWAGAVWQPFTAMFLHANLLHLFLNMISLWSLGEAVERTVGSFRYALLYFVSGLMSSLFVVIFQYNLSIATIGASGAIFGLLGAIGIFYPRSTLLIFFFPMRALTAVFVFGLLSLGFIFYDHFTGSPSFFSHFGHLGGLVGGVLYSKFALQLPFLKNKLEMDGGGGFRPFQRRNQGRTMEEELREVMRKLQEERNGAAVEPEKPLTSDERPEPFNTLIRDEGDGKGRRIFFDPETGRFYIR